MQDISWHLYMWQIKSECEYFISIFTVFKGYVLCCFLQTQRRVTRLPLVPFQKTWKCIQPDFGAPYLLPLASQSSSPALRRSVCSAGLNTLSPKPPRICLQIDRAKWVWPGCCVEKADLDQRSISDPSTNHGASFTSLFSWDVSFTRVARRGAGLKKEMKLKSKSQTQ